MAIYREYETSKIDSDKFSETKQMKSPFNIENILKACPVLFKEWKKRPFILDMEGKDIVVKYFKLGK